MDSAIAPNLLDKYNNGEFTQIQRRRWIVSQMYNGIINKSIVKKGRKFLKNIGLFQNILHYNTQ